MRQHSGNFVICLSKKLPLQNCAAPEKCGYFLKMRKGSEGILCVFQAFFPKYWGNTRLFRQFITMVRRPKALDFFCVRTLISKCCAPGVVFLVRGRCKFTKSYYLLQATYRIVPSAICQRTLTTVSSAIYAVESTPLCPKKTWKSPVARTSP